MTNLRTSTSPEHEPRAESLVDADTIVKKYSALIAAIRDRLLKVPTTLKKLERQISDDDIETLAALIAEELAACADEWTSSDPRLNSMGKQWLPLATDMGKTP